MEFPTSKMKRVNRQYKIINGVLYRLCECEHCDEYILVGKTCHGVKRRFVKGHGCWGISKESRKKQGIKISGENNGRYIDGRKEKLNEWIKEVKERDNYTCQRCRKVKRKGNRNLHAHHIKPRDEYPELIYDVDNGKTLCRSCHKTIHMIGKKYMLGKHQSEKTKEKISKGQQKHQESIRRNGGEY